MEIQSGTGLGSGIVGPLDDDQRATLAAEKTPVTKALRAGTEIRTTVR